MSPFSMLGPHSFLGWLCWWQFVPIWSSAILQGRPGSAIALQGMGTSLFATKEACIHAEHSAVDLSQLFLVLPKGQSSLAITTKLCFSTVHYCPHFSQRTSPRTVFLQELAPAHCQLSAFTTALPLVLGAICAPAAIRNRPLTAR